MRPLPPTAQRCDPHAPPALRASIGFAEAARTGRFLVHVLATDAADLAQARDRIARQSLYGLLSIERAAKTDELPFADCLANVLVIEPSSASPSAPRRWRA